ncbi:hypothetical protein, partial [Deinococcus apachensis]|uniref:hypothetical protein n=1 Tax=Deinococcus apachensis TaxID=309886 RepID=UPI001B7F8BA4
MTAEERGELLAQVMTWQDRSRPAVLTAHSGPAGAGVGQGAPSTAEDHPRPAQRQAEGLRPSGEVPQGLSAYARAVLADLDRGG